MKPHKNAKISHYDTGKPWDKKKPNKPEEAETFAEYVNYKISIKAVKAPEYIDIYTATALKPGVNVFPKGTDVQWIEGTQVVVKKKQIVNKHKNVTGLKYFDWQWDAYWYSQLFPTFTTAKDEVRANIEAFLNEPMPEPEKSILILSKEFEEQRRRDLYKEKLAAFIEDEVEAQLSLLRKKLEVALFGENLWSQRAEKMAQENFKLNAAIDALHQQIEQLKNYKARIETATAHIGECSRHFRAED